MQILALVSVVPPLSSLLVVIMDLLRSGAQDQSRSGCTTGDTSDIEANVCIEAHAQDPIGTE